MKILYCGDVVGRAGRDAFFTKIEEVKKLYTPDVIIANVENASHGFGVTPGICRDFLEKGANVLITGNHVWNQREIIPFLNDCKYIIRPLNYPNNLSGRGACEFTLPNGRKILVAQVLGRLFMEAVDCPVQAIDNLLKNYNLGKNIDAIFVDIHAEATSEKLAFGYYLDGKVSAVIGTHTHVPTSDAKILPQGTAYQTDTGMCGDYNSVLGFEIDEPINRLTRKYTGNRLVPGKGIGFLSGVVITTDDKTGLALSVQQIFIK